MVHLGRIEQIRVGAGRAKTARQVEFRMPMAEGTDKVLRMVVAPVPSNGEVVLQCVALDITARTRTEQALAEYRREVWHIGRVATAGAMATAMAHELNQPLAAITHTAQACRRLLAAGQLGTPDLAQNLVVISEQAMRASEIIKNIRSFVRKTPDRKGPVDVARLVHDAVRLAGPLARQSGIDIEVDIDRLDRTLSIAGDELQLGQMLFNLVRNAEDAVAGNPRSQRHIKITAATNGNRRVRVDVSDNGPGIAPEARSRIFEPFFTTRQNGLGMGLAISQTIAEAHGAVLGLASAGGCGSGAVFSIEFLADND